MAFDAIAAIGARSGGSLFRDVDGIIEKNFEGMPVISFSDSYYKFLLENYSFEEVENMDLSTLAKVFPDCIRTNEWIDSEMASFLKEQYIQGFKILEDMDFTRFWEENCLPFLTEQCTSAETTLKEDSKTENILSDIQKLKPGTKLDDVIIYVSYFCSGVSFQLTGNSYFTNFVSQQVESDSTLRLFTHELIHSFSNEELKEIYIRTYQTDEFMKKTNYILFDVYRSSSDEEEFVVALEKFILFKNGLLTEEVAYVATATHYKGCMPVALIVFDELMKLSEIPEDINSWIYSLFENEVIKVGEIESKAESISPGFVERFMDNWSDELSIK